jgi:hypothetical protein
MTMKSKMLRVFAAVLAGLGAAAAAIGAGGQPGAAVPCQRSVAIDPQVTASEAAGTLTFVVYTGSCPAAGTVSYVVTDSTARRPGDFQLTGGRFFWGVGDASTRTISAEILDDRLIEAPLEDFAVVLVQASDDIRVVGAVGLGRIFDDDTARPMATVDDRICLAATPERGDWPAPAPNWSSSPVPTPSPSLSPSPLPTPTPWESACTIEPGHISFTRGAIRLNITNAAAQSVQFRTSDGSLLANLDYVPVQREVVIPPGETTVFVEVKLLPHAFLRGGYFNVHISGYTGGGQVVAGDARITVVI